ncbi:MAG: deoxyribose-phosphate aldolase [Christensenellaceae bacterium]|nr:deoxyribose-phosphate aldolase [Christensenellaceae bacterium]
MKQLTHQEIAKMMDISLLQPQFTREDIDKLIDLAIKYDMASVCAKGYDVAYCAKKLAGTTVKVGGSAAFPHGNSTKACKLFEAQQNIDDGAEELDTVMPIGLIRSGMYDYARDEIAALAELCHRNNVILKVIFENYFLTPDEIKECCFVCNDAKADFVKTSTGYTPTGAKLDDVIIMRKYADPSIEVKAAGGIRTLDDFMAYYEAGATRQGTRAAAEIVDEAISRGW